TIQLTKQHHHPASSKSLAFTGDETVFAWEINPLAGVKLQHHGGDQRSLGAVSYRRRGFLPRRSRSVGRVQVLPPDTK
ncbi:unnamed protein product, partial [Ectocarpus sp. 13 AM-2016]